MGKKKRPTKIAKAPTVRAGAHKAGQKIRQKAKGQPGRAKVTPYHRNLGPMGELGMDIVIEVSITDDLDQYQIREFNYKNVATILESTIYEPLREYLMGPGRGGVSGLINTTAPRDTGALRESLEDGVEAGLPSIDDFQKKVGPFSVKLGTPEIPYAKPVNKMPTTWLRHPKQSAQRAHLNVGRRGKKLKDPEARSGWYNLILLNGRNKARRLYDAFIKEIITLLAPLKVRIAKSKKGAVIDTRNLAMKIFKVRFK